MKGYWFKMRGRQLLKEMEPEAVFGFCDGWFDRFKVRHKISFRRATNVTQKPAEDKKQALQTFHRNIRQVYTGTYV